MLCILTNIIITHGIRIESNYLSCVPSGLPYCDYITTEIESTLTETEHNEVWLSNHNKNSGHVAAVCIRDYTLPLTATYITSLKC